MSSRKRLTTEEFIKKSKEIHGDKYDYSLVEYKNNRTRVKIICPIHGVFEQRPKDHLYGQGCSKCSGNYERSTNYFIEKAKSVYGDKYDYSLVEYVNARTRVKIICPIHGVFEQFPNNHLKGHGCPKCSGNYNMDTEYFVEQARKIHGKKYDYSNVKYIKEDKKVSIICPKHGNFLQTPHNHLSGQGCPKCGLKTNAEHRTKTTEEFINCARKIHGDKYDYSLVKYKDSRIKVSIICPIHGVFEQKPKDHLCNHGCPICNEYNTEKDIKKILQKENIDNVEQKTFKWLIYKSNMRLDFYIPKYKVAIECQGIQHFKKIDFFGGEDYFLITIDRDKKKRELCEQHGIKVFYYANYKYKFPYKVYTNPEELINDIKKIDPV